MDDKSNDHAKTSSPVLRNGSVVEGEIAKVILVHPPNATARRWIAWLGWMLFLVAVVALYGLRNTCRDYFDTSNGLAERYVSGSTNSGSDKVAILSIPGLIASGDGYVKHQIDRIRDDEDVKAVVIRVNSPGGTITGSDYIYHHLTKLRDERKLPMVVSMGSIAASGGYYVAMAVGDEEKSIYAEPTTTTGSIGVIIPHYDISGIMADYRVKDDSIATHPRKRMLSMTKPISDDDREVLGEYIGTAFDRFKEVVKSGRPKFRDAPAELDALATGEVFAATKAKRLGLVDELGFVEDAVARAIELGGLKEGSTRVVKYAAPTSVADVLGLPSMKARSVDIESILEFSTPKAYYLASTLPVFFSTDD